MFNHLVGGDGESAERHREFYDEYLAVMDLDAAYYMQTVETVFIRHALPKGEMRHRAMQVPAAGMPFGPTLLPTIFRESHGKSATSSDHRGFIVGILELGASARRAVVAALPSPGSARQFAFEFPLPGRRVGT